jgi:UDP-N-acetylglucosamine 2-epimerase
MTVLGYITGVIGIVLFLGTVVVYLSGSRDKGTIATLEASNRSLSERVSILEANETRLTSRVAHVEAENAELRAQRPSAEAIAGLAQQVTTIGEQMTEVIDMLAKHDSDIKTILGKATR